MTRDSLCLTLTYAIVIESKWFRIMNTTTLYLYEFDPREFVLQDDIAGYYVAKTTQYPKEKYILTDLFALPRL
ncbi:MAG: DUF6886 family protein [Clostridia bacterium]|jgi:hypothetical protein|uniref:DUF6886 family protein n=1 Tax=Bianquea renquensis TaxID=2763661 RepID=UPI003A353F84